MGILREIKTIQEHKKIDLSDDFFDRVEKNKGIYKSYYKDWHDIAFTNSRGEKKDRRMASLGMGKVLPQKMAQLIFNEKCKIDVSTKGLNAYDDNVKDEAKEFINGVLDDNNFYRDFQRYLEYGYALGGIAIKPYFDGKKIKLAYATADSFIPLSNDANNIDEALFITREKKDKLYYTLLEWHEWVGDTYVITNELYESQNSDILGRKVSLNTLYEDLLPRVEIENLSRPQFTYIKLNTANNKDLNSPLGVSVFENSYDTLYLLDYLFDYFLHEFKLGKRRIAVDYSMIKPHILEDGKVRQVFDTDDTVFKALNTEQQGVQDLSVGLRVDEIVKALNTALDTLSMQVGFSSGTFTFDGNSVMTATEVVSINSQTYQTKNSHEIIVEHSLKQLIVSIIELANIYDLYNGDSDVEVAIDFDDSIAQDREQNYNYYATAYKDGLIPRKEVVKRVYKLTDKEADEWIMEIKKEQADSLELVNTFSGDEADIYGIGASNRKDALDEEEQE
ncbi:phage portal protein [Helcococcus kunzii]|uniref:phage portal protein n=1 Tax=Helcococcus kunzii TaxID=40091 RepID=UPI0038A7B26C